MNSRKPVLSSLLTACLWAWQAPVPIAAAEPDVTGWDCVRTPAGVFDCTPAPQVAEPPARPAPPLAAPVQPPEPEAPPAPRVAEPEAPPITEPAAEPAAPQVAEPIVEPAPEPTAPAAPTVAEPQPEPTAPAVAEPAPEPEPAAPAAPRLAEPEQPTPAPPVARPEAAPEPAPDEPEAAPALAAAIAPVAAPHTDPAWELCGPMDRKPPAKVSRAERADAPVQLTADEVESQEGGRVATFRGDVDVQRADQHLTADEIRYYRDDSVVEARGNVRLQDDGITLQGAAGRVELDADRSRFEDATYALYDKHARGGAKVIDRDGQAEITRLEGVTYTTCNPGNDDWQLSATKITLDHAEGVGTARNTVVRFKDVPIFYSPFLTFPLDDRRKSGFLTPSLGNSDESGVEFSIPYYWNLAPDRDATLTPRILSKRGLQLGAEYRYLNPTSFGQVNAEVLPSDDLYDDDRLLFAYRHRGRFTPRWLADVNFNYVSDDEYFEDLGTDISLTSTTHLERRADLRYQGTFWSALARVQGFQTIDDAVPTAGRPYDRLPQFLVQARLPNQAFGLDLGFEGEAVYFDRRNSITGLRLDLLPSVSLPMRRSYGYITPKLGLRHTQYDLENALPGSDNSPSRTTPIFSVDSGLFVERDTTIAGNSYVQTLEPRLFYLYVPFRDQDDLIVDESGRSVVFDTNVFDFSFAQLFRENRFSSADRQGDADQLTAALTTRIIDPASGAEHFKASVGQIFYFRDREVTLPGGIGDGRSTSDIVAEVRAQIGPGWNASAGWQWNTNAEQTEKGVVQLRYQPEPNRIFNLGYRFRRNFLEQADLSFAWPITRQLSAVGRWYYALDADRTVDVFAGLEYETCCWVLRLVGREYVNDFDDDKNTAVLLQLELKGLTSFGDRVTRFLERGILGYGRGPYREDEI